MSSNTPQPLSESKSVAWSKVAVIGLGLGTVGMVTLWLGFGLILVAGAAICGHVARYETESNRRRGRFLATFDLCLGYGGMVLFPILLITAVIAYPVFNQWQSKEVEYSTTASRERAFQLFIACESYARTHDDRYPVDWEDLAERFIPSDKLVTVLRSPYPQGAEIAFKLVPHRRPVLAAAKASTVVIEEQAPPQIPKIVLVYADGEIEFQSNPDYERKP